MYKNNQTLAHVYNPSIKLVFKNKIQSLIEYSGSAHMGISTELLTSM